MIIALAGRRVDPPDATEPRFPPGNAALVGERVGNFLSDSNATALVCAAACGSDILALEAAGQLGLLRRVVLPLPREEFRRMSVADRGGDWGERYDRIMDDVEQAGELLVLDVKLPPDAAFSAGNSAILDEAVTLARELRMPAMAVAVWNGKSRGPGDLTEEFINDAKNRQIEIRELSTV